MRQTPPRSSRQQRERGFTLIELTVVIAIIAILAATLLPVLTQPFLQERRAEVTREMAAIEEGIFGRPELGDYGFLGTVGRFPSTNFTSSPELLAPSGIPAGFLSTAGVPMGWQGPYLRVATSAPLTDPWGQPYQLLPNANNATAVQQQFQLRSTGPDITPGTPDDIYYPLNSGSWWNAVVTTLNVDVFQSNGATTAPVPDNTPVTLVLPPGANGGNVEVTVNLTTTSGRVTFNSSTATRAPMGMLGLKITFNGNTYLRQVTALRPVTTASVYVPAGSITPVPCNYGPTLALSNGTYACQSGSPLFLNVSPGQVVDATFTGGWHSNTANTACYAAISFNDDIPLGTNLTLAGNAQYAPAAVNSSTVTANQPIFLNRSIQYNNTTAGMITAKVYIWPASTNTCTIDGASLVLKSWKP